MGDKLNFSLPESKGKGSLAARLSLVLLGILVALVVAVLFSLNRRTSPAVAAGGAGLSSDQTRQLATRLSGRGLHRAAARAWQDYLAVGELTDTERARTLFQIGALLEKAGADEDAIEYYYRSETAAKVGELEPQISARVRDCFTRLGKFSALRYEMMDRTSFKQTEQAGGSVVAEIGAAKITEAELDSLIEQHVENALAPWRAFMADGQFGQQKRKMLEQYRSPQAKLQFLQQWIAEEVLYRQALEEQLADKEQVKKLLNEQARRTLSQQLLGEQLAARIHVTETDLQTYYSANKGRYVEPAEALISHISVDDEQRAKELIEQLKGGEEFGTAAREHSIDEATKAEGGRIETQVVKGAYVAGIGGFPELNEKIFAVEPGQVLDEPFKTDKGWEIIRVDDKQPERQGSFDEVREQVLSSLLSEKQQDRQDLRAWTAYSPRAGQ
jgi:peptidyl-prolyl cis-trans isomerase C